MDENVRQVRVNPYRLFQIDPESHFTRAHIRDKMRKLVLSTHPDRPGGSDRKFRIVMECYKHILKVIAERDRINVPVTDDTIQEHTRERNTSHEIPNANAKRFYGSKKFNREAFNTFFEENRLDDSLQNGHGDWLKNESEEYEAKHHEKMGKGQFQEAFEEERRRLLAKKQIVKHTGVVPMSIGKSRLAATDVDEIGMMSQGSAGTVRCSNGVMGVDLREALEVGVLGVDGDTNYEGGPVSMEEARRQRETARMTFTDAEKREYDAYQAEQARQEKERKRRIQERDEQIHAHFQRINRMITN